MPIAALTTWIITACGGLYLLAVWLIEDEGPVAGAATTRLRPTVVFSHAVLAMSGLIAWVIYVLADDRPVARAALAILLPVALLGLWMLSRWISVHRDPGAALGASASLTAAAEPERSHAVPAERNFPVAVVLGHGLFAAATILLVALTVLGVGES